MSPSRESRGNGCVELEKTTERKRGGMREEGPFICAYHVMHVYVLHG